MKSIKSLVLLALLAGVFAAGPGFAMVSFNGDTCGSLENVCICDEWEDPDCQADG